MKNPLNKRLLRELTGDIGKYIVIFLFVAGLIALVSGFLVADNSMLLAYNESFEKYHIEDGNFELALPLEDTLLARLEQEGVHIYENYYVEKETEEVDSTLRIFIQRTEINLACLMKGEMPDGADEIAIDRMYADNNDISVGDQLTVGGRILTVSGLIALSDYSTMFASNSDMMFDAVKFGVAVMTKEGFENYSKGSLHYNYSWKYDMAPKNDSEVRERAEELLMVISRQALVKNYIPAYANKAIQFTGDDMGGDKIMFTVFLYIVIVIIAFVFAITTGNTIVKEASVIGTLRASGYTQGELLRHYITMPLLVTLIAAVIGNILGYTVFKDYMAGMYYGSYSLPTYVTRWNGEAFVSTTVVPFFIMMAVNLFILNRKLKLSPLQFLRHDLSNKPKKKAFRLNTKIKFFTRFRIRIIFQNLPNYTTLLVGILFANFILLFGFLFKPLLNKYQEDIYSNMICDYQYILKMPVETEIEQAEKYSVNTLKALKEGYMEEEVTVYGIAENSRYVDIPLEKAGVYISEGYAQKYGVKIGDTVSLEETYGDQKFTFQVSGIYEYPGAIAVFMSCNLFRNTFEYEDDYYNGYFTNVKLTDLNEESIAAIITEDDMTKVSRQLMISMGEMMTMFVAFGVIMFTLLIYLLSKLIIEKNAQAISMAKILGYSGSEIARLYVLATTIVVILSLILTVPLCDLGMRWIFENVVYSKMTGWLPYYVSPEIYLKMPLLGMLCYIAVAVLQLKKIRKIPMSDALKHVE